MKKSIIGSVIALVLFATDVLSGPELVELPTGYQDAFTHYAVINRPMKNQVVFTYANKVAVDSAQSSQILANGSVIVMEVYKAKLDEKGKPLSNDKGLYLKDAMAAIVVMEKQKGWGNAYSEEIRNDDWEYAKYKQNKDKPINKDSIKCLKCHKQVEKKDFIFSFDDLIGVKK